MLTEQPAGLTEAVADPPPLQTTTMSNVWELQAAPWQLESTAMAWKTLAQSARDRADDIRTSAQTVEGDWEGDAATAFRGHRVRLMRDLDQTAAHLDAAADALDGVAGLLRSAQRMLNEDLAALRETLESVSVSTAGEITFGYRTEAQVDAISSAVGAAGVIRADVDAELIRYGAVFDSVRSDLDAIETYWTAGLGSRNGWTDEADLPAEVAGVGVIYDGTRMVISTGTGDDTVEIHVDPETGHRYVEVNGVRYYVPAGMELVVRGADGQDTITVAEGANIPVTVLGGVGNDTITTRGGRDRVLSGAGDDTVNTGGGSDVISTGTGADTVRAGAGMDRVFTGDDRDRVYGGTGNDRINAGADNDYIEDFRGDDQLRGGAGDDTIYGGSGRDSIGGEEGRDYLEGGRGNDLVAGGSGGDVLSGGRDHDTLRGGTGDDTMYGGHGTDRVAGEAGRDTAYVQSADTADAERVDEVELADIPDISIGGDEEYQERVEQDLEMLRGSPAGVAMYEEFDKFTGRGHTIAIEPSDDGGNHASVRKKYHINPWDENYTISYAPEDIRARDDRPPVAGLYHEMGHVFDYGNDTAAGGHYQDNADPDSRALDDHFLEKVLGVDTVYIGVDNDERAVVGLPIDEDDDPDTPAEHNYDDHPRIYTENGFREEMGVPERERYGTRVQPHLD